MDGNHSRREWSRPAGRAGGRMGSPMAERDRFAREEPQHPVTLPRARGTIDRLLARVERLEAGR